MTAFVDIGITLLLFMAGMEVDIPGLIKRWKLLLINGLDKLSVYFYKFRSWSVVCRH
ncbi:MAG: hypothetical protein Ct9H300mP28_17470 [Pseudomonadota bacterium]|nr:MAG: hypothetical protein Ct9H300mP28_17470 [Pseudomonadota bacterium]